LTEQPAEMSADANRGQAEGVVQLAVASRVEPVAFAVTAGGFDGGGAVVGREPLWPQEPGGVTGVAQDDPATIGPTMKLQQRHLLELAGNAGGELVDLR
jgi:hypothetical protein